ncbi:hypothetical protein [Moraxella sp. ZY200743]|uniref:hypothetical protein n=1 Tax=Moraxella sp. ZY200743 TaxID=2911970 RepID=UPI003D7EEB48
MYHRKTHKYKEYEGMENIVVGQGELVRVFTSQGVGWRTPSGTIIYNKQDAINYATRLDEFIRYHQIRVATQKSKLKH